MVVRLRGLKPFWQAIGEAFRSFLSMVDTIPSLQTFPMSESEKP
jgi:hypothetical protein